MLEKKKKAVEDFFAVLPHSISLGMKIDFIRDGEVGMSMLYDKKLIKILSEADYILISIPPQKKRDIVLKIFSKYLKKSKFKKLI